MHHGAPPLARIHTHVKPHGTSLQAAREAVGTAADSVTASKAARAQLESKLAAAEAALAHAREEAAGAGETSAAAAATEAEAKLSEGLAQLREQLEREKADALEALRLAHAREMEAAQVCGMGMVNSGGGMGHGGQKVGEEKGGREGGDALGGRCARACVSLV